MKITESKSQALYKEYLFEKVEKRGTMIPSLVLAVVLLFTLT